MIRSPAITVGLLLISSAAIADSLKPETEKELAEYKTVETAVVTSISHETKRAVLNTPAYLGCVSIPVPRRI